MGLLVVGIKHKGSSFRTPQGATRVTVKTLAVF